MLIRPLEDISTGFGAIKNKIDSDYNANQAIWQIWWTEATLDTRLEAGDTSLMAELNTNLPNNNRGSYYFNRTRPLCNMVSGYQRRNRKSTIVVPLENGDQETADQWSRLLLQIFKKENLYETISDAFHQGACISGMNLLHVYLDFKDDPVCGDLKVDNCAYNSFIIDPYFRKTDLSDCQFVWRRSYMSHSAAASLLPDSDYDAIMALPGNPTGTGRDGRFQYMPESYGQTQQNRLAYDEYYYRDYRKQKRLVDKRTGDYVDISDREEGIDIPRYLADNPQIRLDESWIPTVRLCILVQDKVFYDGPQPLNLDCFPFIPVVGYYNPMMPYFYTRIQGICRSLRDPQMLFNRRVILSADLAESLVNSGFIFKENSVIDVKHLFQTGQGRIIPLKQTAQMTDVQQIQPPQIPPSYFQLQETFSKEMNMVSGINEELIGSAIDDKAGILAALRQGAGLTTLQPLFDKLDHSQIMLSELFMKAIRMNYTPMKISHMLEGAEPAPLFYNKAFGKYHCQVELGFNTESQKQMQFAQLLQLKELGVQLPDGALLNASTIQNKTEIIKMVEQAAQAAQQAQQQQSQVQMQELQARAQLAMARAGADEGLEFERKSRVQENRALAIQKIAEANKDDEMATLNKIKAVKELESIDIGHLEKLIQLVQLLKSGEQAEEAVTKTNEELKGAQEAPIKAQQPQVGNPTNQPPMMG